MNELIPDAFCISQLDAVQAKSIEQVQGGGRIQVTASIICGMSAILAIDQGTTGSTALVFSRQGEILGRAYSEFTQHYPEPGWVEHDAEEIWQVSRRVMAEAITNAGLGQHELSAIGITNQRETTVIWDRETGKPVYRAIVWQSRQSAPICEQLSAQGHEPIFRKRTGLVMDAYFSGTKIRWILDQDPELQRRAEAGELAFGTIDSWLLWKLTGGSANSDAVHATDPTNASRTLLYNIHEHRWDPELCRLLNIPAALLPKVRPSSGVFGTSCSLDGIPAGVPIAGMAGDQQAALYGQGCWYPGQAKNTYGTGCFLLMNMGDEHPVSDHGLLTTICCDAHGKPAYALEGSVFMAGAAVQWLRDELGIIDDAAETEALAGQIANTEGVYLVPAFAGLGAPYWDMNARGGILGLTRGVGRVHIARAALESIAYQSRDLVEAMNRDSGIELTELRADGGAARNNFLMQFQADILGVPLIRPALVETTAAGSAFLAGLAVGLWSGPEELKGARSGEHIFEPAMDAGLRGELYNGWRRAVERIRTTTDREQSIPGEEAQSANSDEPLQETAHANGKMTTSDGLELFWQSWTPVTTRGLIVLVHGMAEHSGRYAATAKYFAQHGWAVYACDLRGHGFSSDGHKPGRVHVDRFSDYARDIDVLLALATKRHPDVPRLILGHSMGGLISLSYALDKPESLDGAVISSPALGIHPEFAPPLMLKLLVRVLSLLAPRARFSSDLDANTISRDPKVVKAYIDDPLVSEKVSARWYAEIMKAADAAHERAANLRIPMLLMQSGSDRLVDPDAAPRWSANAPAELVDLVVWEGLFHEMFNEPEKDRVRARVTDWLDKLFPRADRTM
jgi:glycerol kinase